MLKQRGELLEQARKTLDGTGHQFKKGKSRSKYFGTRTQLHSSKAKYPKLDNDLRMFRIKEINEALTTIMKKVSFKIEGWRLLCSRRISSCVTSSQRKYQVFKASVIEEPLNWNHADLKRRKTKPINTRKVLAHFLRYHQTMSQLHPIAKVYNIVRAQLLLWALKPYYFLQEKAMQKMTWCRLLHILIQ